MSHNGIDFYYNKEDISNNLDKPTGYDEDLLSMLKKIDLSKNNFIVLHQRGSHSPYKNQYPKYFDKLQSEYENTILYTDFVLNNTCKQLQLGSMFNFVFSIGFAIKPTYVPGARTCSEPVYRHILQVFYCHSTSTSIDRFDLLGRLSWSVPTITRYSPGDILSVHSVRYSFHT